MSRKSLEYYKSIEYNIIVQPQEMDGEKWYEAYCNEFGVSACHGLGDTPSEALASFIVEKNAFIEFLFDKGEFIPEKENCTENTVSGVFTVRTSPWVHSSLIRQAKKEDVSLNAYINQILCYGAGSNSIAHNTNEKLREVKDVLLVETSKILEKVNALHYDTDELFNKKRENKISLLPSYDHYLFIK